MALDPFLMRLVKGNAATTLNDPQDTLPVHQFVGSVRMAYIGQITRLQLETEYDLTHADDAADLDGIVQAVTDAAGAGLLSSWLHEFEMRLIQAEDKSGPSGLNGRFGFAVKTTLLTGADGSHDLRTTGISPPADRFTSWAAGIG